MCIQNASLNLCSLPRALEMFILYLTYVHIEAGTIHCYTPSPQWGTGLEGGYVTLALLQNFISTSETLVQIGMWCYLEFVCSSYLQYHCNGPPKFKTWSYRIFSFPRSLLDDIIQMYMEIVTFQQFLEQKSNRNKLQPKVTCNDSLICHLEKEKVG
jgi:hypothetical protein